MKLDPKLLDPRLLNASRFRVRTPWRARANAGVLERALIGAFTFVLAIPVALIVLAIALVALVAFLGCAVVAVAFVIALAIVRKLTGAARVATPRVADEGRENVRVIRRQEGGE